MAENNDDQTPGVTAQDFEYGELNPVTSPLAPDPMYNPHTSGYYNTERQLQKDHFTVDAFENRNTFRAIVLRVENPGGEEASSDPSLWTRGVSEFKKLAGIETAPTTGLQVLKVMVPELHPAPNPGLLAADDTEGVHQGRINNFYPTVIAESNLTPRAQPGDVVYIEFTDADYTSGVYIAPVIGNPVDTTQFAGVGGAAAFANNVKLPAFIENIDTSAGDLASYQPFARIVAPAFGKSPPKDYQLTLQDVLWAARMAVFETRGDNTADAAAVLWTMTQLFAAPRCKYSQNKFPRFYRMLQAYSQPINPIWLANGSKCRPGSTYGPGGEKYNSGYKPCHPHKLRARASHQRATWETLKAKNPENAKVIIAWATGKLPNPVPRSIEFAASKVSQNFVNKKKNAGSVIAYRPGNWHIITRCSSQFPDNHVKMVPGGSQPQANASSDATAGTSGGRSSGAS